MRPQRAQPLRWSKVDADRDDDPTTAANEPNRYARVCRYVSEHAWAMRPETLLLVLDALTFRAAGGRLTRAEIDSRLLLAERSRADVGMILYRAFDQEMENEERARKKAEGVTVGGPAASGSVAVIPIYGVIAHRQSTLDDASAAGAGLDRFMARFRTASNDPNVRATILDIESPGGTIDGVPEAADEIRAARDGGKKIIAVANSYAASAAYWLASAASEIVVTPSGMVGSIGVYGAHEDISGMLEQMGVKVTLVSAGKFKTEGNPFEPLTDEAHEAMQAMVDGYFKMFVDAVAKGRGVKAKDVRDGFGQGRMVLAADAVAAGMADRVATLEQTIDRALGRKAGGALAPTRAEPHAPTLMPSAAAENHLALRRRRLSLFGAKSAPAPIPTPSREGSTAASAMTTTAATEGAQA